MAKGLQNYWQATRHPWSCVLFVLPLLAVYEFGERLLANGAPEDHRNGAEVWLRQALAAVGISPAYGAPCLLLGVLGAWAIWRRQDRPKDQAGVWAGMAGESAAFAVALLALSRGLWYVLRLTDRLRLSWPDLRGGSANPALEQIIGFFGAGIYEETLFRLVLFSGLVALFALTDFPPVWGFMLAAAASALLFAGAHHLGPHGEPWQATYFTFRTAAGVYFAALYRLRGFGIVVGAHAFYDVLVGLVVGVL